MKAEKLLGLNYALQLWMKLKNGGSKFYESIIDIKHAIKNEIEILDEKLKLYQKDMQELRYDMGIKKDEKLQYEGPMVQGLLRGQQPLFDTEAQKIEDAKEDLYKSEININIETKINKKSLPEGYDGDMYEAIMEFLE